MTVAVVGGSGFIGTRLCALLAHPGDREFVVVDRNQSEAFPDASRRADIAKTDTLAATIPHGAAIVNLAAAHRDDVKPPERYDEVNVQGARNVCAAARQRDVPTIVFTSSVTVYGLARPGTDETGRLAPCNRFGESKRAAEGVYRQWQAECSDQRSLVIVRAAPVFGDGSRGNVGRLFRQLAESKFVMVGNGRNTKSLAYVENVAAFIAFSLTFGSGVHVYNYVDKPDLTTNDLVAFVRHELGANARVRLRIPYTLGLLAGMAMDAASRLIGREFGISAERVRRFCADSQFDSAVAETGFVPPVSLEEGLRATLWALAKRPS